MENLKRSNQGRGCTSSKALIRSKRENDRRLRDMGAVGIVKPLPFTLSEMEVVNSIMG
jgi:hypothetical protein